MLSLLALLFPALSLAQGQNGDYQKYMSQYASQYQNYMQGASGNRGDGYQKYYKKYMAQYGSDSAGGYEKYMSKYAGDYASKYMPSESSGSAESSQDGKKPVSFVTAEDADTSKSSKDSAQQSENAAGKGGFQKYMDYAKYTQGHGTSEDSVEVGGFL